MEQGASIVQKYHYSLLFTAILPESQPANKDTILLSITPPHRPVLYRRSVEKYDDDLDSKPQTPDPMQLVRKCGADKVENESKVGNPTKKALINILILPP